MSLEERKTGGVSMRELQRRWKIVRDYMIASNLDVLIMQSARAFTGGYVRWFTDVPAGYPRTVLFHANDPMTIVEHGPAGKRRNVDPTDVTSNPGVGEIFTTSAFPSVYYTQTQDATVVESILRYRASRHVGLINEAAMPNGFVSLLRDSFGGSVTFSNETNFIDQIKAIKSDEEIMLIRKTAKMQDAVFEKVLSSIKPGMRDTDVTALAQYEGQRLGSEQGIFLGSSAPPGRPAFFVSKHLQGRVIREGDHMSLLIENNGIGGFYTELGRTIILGKASSQMREGFEIVKAAQAETAYRLKHNAVCGDLLRFHNGFMHSHGAPGEARLYAHSQGYDLVERPLLREDESMAIQKGMNIAVHPAYASQSIFAHICDNYLVDQENMAERLHGTPQQLFEL